VTPQPDPYERARAILAELESISAQSAPASPVPEPAAESGGRRFDLAQPDQPGPDHEQPGPDRDQQPGPDRAPQTGPDRAPQTGPLQRTGPVNGSGRRREPDDRAGLPPLPRRRGVNGHGGANSNGGANEDRGANGDGGASGNGNPAPRPDWQDPYASPAGGPASRADLPFPPWPPDQDANGGPAAPPRSRPPADAGLREIAAQVLAASQAAEGRTVFGSYGSSGLTPAILRIAAQLPVGGLAAGSEANTVKPADRFTAKLAKLAARNPGLPPAELARSIGDAVRYAFTFEPADYTEGTWLVHRKLKAQGFELEARRNRWESPEYKGIFTRWRDPAHGQPFEVQFHTTASWIVAQRTHGSYAQITDPATAPDERARLRARQVAAAAEAKAPPACMEIADFRLEPR
jgi:hypothetical protein